MTPVHIRIDPNSPVHKLHSHHRHSHQHPVHPAFTHAYRVHDGDCFSIPNGGQLEYIRLAAIDAPEMRQPYGTQAADWLHSALLNTPLRLYRRGLDKHGRTIAFVTTHQYPCVSLAIVLHGLAWYYTQFGHNRIDIQAAQQLAQQQRLNIWSDPNPIPPWKFRKNPTRYIPQNSS